MTLRRSVPMRGARPRRASRSVPPWAAGVAMGMAAAFAGAYVAALLRRRPSR